jgi:hypothetical protein
LYSKTTELLKGKNVAFAIPFGLNNSDGRAGTEEMAGKHCRHVHKTVKATISSVLSVHVSDHLSVMEQLSPNWMDFHKLIFEVFLKIC